MALTFRSVLMTAVPALAALLGILWFRRKKKPPSIEESKASAAEDNRESRESSVPKVILTQPSDEGKKVTELVPAESCLSEIEEDIQGGGDGVTSNEGVTDSHTVTSMGDNKVIDTQVLNDIDIHKATDHVEEILTITDSVTLEHVNNSLQDITNKQEISLQSSCTLDKKSNIDSGNLSKEINEEICKVDNVLCESQRSEIDDLKCKTDDIKVDSKSCDNSSKPTDNVKLANKDINPNDEQQVHENRKRKWNDEESWDVEEESPTVSPVDNGCQSTNGSEVRWPLSETHFVKLRRNDLPTGPASNDSGIVATSKASPQPTSVIYEFNFPSDLCGLLIGSRGRNIKHVMDQTGVSIVVKKKVYDPSHQLIIVEGSKNAVDKTMHIFKSKFPAKKYPTVDLGPAPTEHPKLSEIMQISLPEGVSIDVIVSSVVSPNHLFVQQPTHPMFPMLEKQNVFMNHCYNQDGIIPQLPRPVEIGVICAAPMYNGWYRAQVVQTYDDDVDLRFVDYGGYCREPTSALRQIRSDFTTLPFQAVECYLANVIPPKDMSSFPAEANAVVEQTVQGQVSQAEVVGYEEDGVPYVNLYVFRGNKLVLVNRELVERGIARWIEAY